MYSALLFCFSYSGLMFSCAMHLMPYRGHRMSVPQAKSTRDFVTHAVETFPLPYFDTFDSQKLGTNDPLSLCMSLSLSPSLPLAFSLSHSLSLSFSLSLPPLSFSLSLSPPLPPPLPPPSPSPFCVFLCACVSPSPQYISLSPGSLFEPPYDDTCHGHSVYNTTSYIGLLETGGATVRWWMPACLKYLYLTEYVFVFNNVCKMAPRSMEWSNYNSSV